MLHYCIRCVHLKFEKWPPVTKSRFTTDNSYYLVSNFNPFITAFVYDARVSSTINYNALFTSNFDVLAVWQSKDKNFNVTRYHFTCSFIVTRKCTQRVTCYSLILFFNSVCEVFIYLELIVKQFRVDCSMSALKNPI